MAASADHIKALVKSHGSRDDETFYSIALQVTAKAARRGHHKFAAEMKLLADSGRKELAGSVVTPIAQPRGELGGLVVASFSERSTRDLAVGAELREHGSKR